MVGLSDTDRRTVSPSDTGQRAVSRTYDNGQPYGKNVMFLTFFLVSIRSIIEKTIDRSQTNLKNCPRSNSREYRSAIFRRLLDLSRP